MTTELKPGQWVNVKIKSRPRAAAGQKTMVRLFEQDPQVKRERTRVTKSRPVTSHRRGGRDWNDRPRRLQVVDTTPGQTYKVFASVAVLRDLKSIEPYVEVTPA
jgi:hypothetical protein